MGWDIVVLSVVVPATLADPRLHHRETHEGELVAETVERSAATEVAPAQYRFGDGWTSHERLTQDRLRGLSDSTTALTGSVSQVAAVVAEKWVLVRHEL